MHEKIFLVSPNLSMRLSDEDKALLRDLAFELKRSQTDVVRLLIREGRKILPDLKVLANDHPISKSTGRPNKRRSDT